MAENKNGQPKLPEGTWAVTKEDKEHIVELGRELTAFILEYAKKQGETFHAKIVAGAFQYFMDVQAQKAKVVGDDILIAQDAMARFNLGDKISEPFTEIEVMVPTKEEQIEAHKKAIEELEKPEQKTEEVKADEEVENASIAPSPASTGGGVESPYKGEEEVDPLA